MPLLHPALIGRSIVPDSCLRDDPDLVDLPVLRDLTATLAATPQVWRPIIRHRPESRWYTRLLLSATVEVWLIGWYPGQQTEIHDHGGALGALTVAEGAVEEDRYDRSWTISGVRRHSTGAAVGFGAAHVHRVANRGREVATTIHAYSPPESPMRFTPTADARGTAGALEIANATVPRSSAEIVSSGAGTRFPASGGPV